MNDKAGLEGDDLRHGDGRRDDRRADDVRQDVAKDDALMGRAEGDGGRDILSRLGRHHFGANEAGHPEPAGEADPQDQRRFAPVRPEGEQNDQQQDARDGEQAVERAHHHRVGDAADVPGGQTERDTDRGRQHDGEQRDG